MESESSARAAPRELLIVWWSMTGGSRQLAQAAARGAAKAAAQDGPAGDGGAAPEGEPSATAPVAVRLMRADEVGGDDVLSASGYIFATPENLASMAGMMKDFFDRTYYDALDRINGRPYASIVCAGSDGQGAARQIDRIAAGWRLKQVAPALIVCTHAQTREAILAPKTIEPADLERAAELGEALAAGVAMGVW